MEDHPSLPRILPTRPSSSRTNPSTKRYDRDPQAHHHTIEKLQVFGDQTAQQTSQKLSETISADSSTEDIGTTSLRLHNPSSSSLMTGPNTIHDFHTLISYHQASVNQPHQFFPDTLQLSANNVVQPAQQLQSLTLTVFPAESAQSAYSDRVMWDWNSIPEATASRDHGAFLGRFSGSI